MPFDQNSIANELANTRNLPRIKQAVQEGVYIDAAGFEWKVTTQDPMPLDKLQMPIPKPGFAIEICTFRNASSCNCFCLFWFKGRDLADVTVNLFLDGVRIKFEHYHDLQTKVCTLNGKPEDMSKYTKDVPRKPPKAINLSRLR